MLLCLALAGCANKPQCVAWDYTQPMQVYIPVAGMVVQRTVYPCARSE